MTRTVVTRSLAIRRLAIRSLVTRSPAARPVLVAAALLAAAGPGGARLGAQEARPAALPAARPAMTPAEVDERLRVIPDPTVRASVVATISAAGQRGLPIEPLVVKALEGVEKGARPALIESAVRAMAGRLAVASQALAPVVSETELRSGADALGAGVPAGVLREIRAVSIGRSTAVALGVVAQLTARGVPAEKAGAAVAVLVKGGASATHLQELERMIKEDLAVGVSPNTALNLRVRTLISTLPPVLSVPAASDALTTEQFGAPRVGQPTQPTGPRRKP